MMDRSSDRIYDCLITGTEEGTVEQFAARMKNDWNKRAERNPIFYIIGYNAEEEWLRYSGGLDFNRHFTTRFLQLYPESEAVPVILEIGCGIGRMTEFIANRGQLVIAADISAEFLKDAKKRLDVIGIDNVIYKELDGCSLAGIEDNTVDLAFEYIVFQHIGSFDIIESYLKEIGRVLKSGGHFIMHALANDPHGENSINLDNTFHGCNVTYQLMQTAIDKIKALEIIEQQITNSDYWGIIRKR